MDYEKEYKDAMERAKKWGLTHKLCIEDIFPELSESEDERIRTELLSSFKGIMADADEDELWYGLPYNDIIAWLEKQEKEADERLERVEQFRKEVQELGEEMASLRKKIYGDERIEPHSIINGDKSTLEYAKEVEAYLEKQKDIEDRWIEDREQCFWNGVEEGKMLAEKQKEQKPAEWSDYKDKVNVPYCSSEPEWSEEDEHRRKDAVYFLESAMKHYADTSEIEKAIAWLKSLSLNLKKRNEDAAKLCSNEWSEEDERIRKAILGFVNPDKGGTKYSSNAELVEWSDWLKSLRPQPKQEWSEEDETMWSNLIWYLEGKVGMLPSGKERYIKWLKERFVKLVYPKSGWKPSEEQMEAFSSYIKDFQEKAEAAVGGWNNFDVMIRLYEQLKKL